MYDGAMLSFAYGLTAFVFLLAVAHVIGVTVEKWKRTHGSMQKK